MKSTTPKYVFEYKAVTSTAEIKDVDLKNRIVTGYASSFGNKDFDEDIMMPGCYTKSINERGPQGTNEIFMLNQHNWAQPLGKPTVLREDQKGLYYECPVNIECGYANDALVLMDAGLVVQNSVGFQTVKATLVQPDVQDYNTWYREIQEVKLYEYSCVTLGANPDTPFMGFKSMTANEISDQVGIMMKLLRNGTLKDETFALLEIAIKQYGSQLYELGKKSLVETEPPIDTQDTKKPVSLFAGLATNNQQKSVFTFNLS
jgi:hypothetical protein